MLRQLMMFVGAYLLYQLVRGLIDSGSGYKPFGDATRIIDIERFLHIFAEPSIQAWALNKHLLMDVADWTYLNAHYFVTFGALVFIYLRRNDSFYFVRNMFMMAMGIALIGYWLYPTAPPRLLPEWGFTDSISQFLRRHTSTTAPARRLLNFYAAVPSMHVCFAVMIGLPMSGWSATGRPRSPGACTRCGSRSWSSPPATTTSPTCSSGASPPDLGAAGQAAARPRQA